MKVRDLLEMEVDIDVYDNVCDELAVCFVGPMELTENGNREFADVLDYDISLNDGYVTVDVDDEDEDVFEGKLEAAKRLFEAMAGYCSVQEYALWFKGD